ncbi:polyketide synthase [Nocardia abscessus]|uniref:polyketide synthase n=1 Tax=Nocardia abscessus TaxID=120957 RepID=UPI0024563D35|nr:polyketide synthase [Nocardia abscessus]
MAGRGGPCPASPRRPAPPPPPPPPHARRGRAAEPIAVIGVGCRLPGGDTPDAFWRLLAAGESAVREVDPARWDPARFYRPSGGPGLTNSKWGGFVEGVDLFDPAYFGVTDELAWQMDPLQRLLLETSVLATTDAGYRREELAGKRVGVYAGSRAANYFNRIPVADRHTIIGIGQNFIAARISDYFDWHAGNVVLDSACSSSLLSVHLACQALRAGEVDAALAGGVEVLLDEMLFVTLSAAGVLSPHGRCATFSEDADGFVPGEGAALLLLKRLDDALADGDRVYAVLRGSAIGNDGHTMGITTPNMRAQIEVVTAALDMAGMSPDALSYIEAHGTGTMIGDPIELKGLATVLGDRSRGPEPCAVGSVKTNIGHLLSAAGIAGAVKTILAVHHAALPPSLHCDNLNPRFKFTGSPLQVNRELRPWRPADGRPRAAGVSSFGFGGTNAHLVVEQAPDGHRPTRRPLDPPVFRKRSFMLPKTVPSTPTEPAPRIVVPMPQNAPAPSFLRVEPLR